jgi:molecular chaperone GrpE (heat shock protein)
MLKKCLLLGMAVLLVGGLAYGWLYKEGRVNADGAGGARVTYSLKPEEYLDKYGRWYSLSAEEQNRLVLELDEDRKSKTAEQLAEEQQARLRTDLDKLAAGTMNPGDIADYLYGEGWEQVVEAHKQRKTKRQSVQTTSIVCLSIGGTIIAGCIAFWFLRLLFRMARALKRRCRRSGTREDDETPGAELTEVNADVSPLEGDDVAGVGSRSSVSGWSAASGREGTESSGDPDMEDQFVLPPLEHQRTRRRSTPACQPAPEDSGVALLLTDEKASDRPWSPDMEWSAGNGAGAAPERRRFTPRPKVAVLGREHAILNEPSLDQESESGQGLNAQADDLQRQLAEIKQMAQNVQQSARDQSDPVGNTLKELASQVSAIREYAASQQNRVEKLQDGYDWNIVRTFCLRVIRCIDNLEMRIENVDGNKELGEHLEDVRDELLFALESSGVEQYRPEVNSEYRGQEKLAEAIKQKETPKKSDQAGKIAKVVRPGYRYIIDEESCKVVRTAQVKLFG